MPTSYSSRPTVSTNYDIRTKPISSYNTRTTPVTDYSVTSRVSWYYLIDEENNYITDEEGYYILVVGEGSDGLPISDYNGRTSIAPTSYSTRNPI